MLIKLLELSVITQSIYFVSGADGVPGLTGVDGAPGPAGPQGLPGNLLKQRIL
jgi:hypothetical protein